MLSEERRRGDRRRLGFISRIDLFRGVPYSAVEGVLAQCPVRSFDADEVLLRPGQTNTNVYLVLEGHLQVHLDAADSGNTILVEAGGCIGEMSIIDGKPVSAFVLAARGSRIAMLGQEQFWAMILDHPRVVRNVLAMLTERMRHSNEAALEGLKEKLVLEHMQKELRLAREIQEGMLASAFHLPGLAQRVDLHASMQAAREVGGDLYDFFVLPQGHLCLLVGDVSDKGMPAALFMARAIEIVRVVARLQAASGPEEPDPASILAKVNSALCQNNPSRMFVTMLLAILDPRTGTLSYCNAGHNSPYIRSRDAGILVALEAKHSAPLGVAPATVYRGTQAHLNDGDMLFLYSDGITEATDSSGLMFGEERLERELREMSGYSAAAFTGDVLAAVRRFAGDAVQSDDITVLAARLLPGAQGRKD
jgi:sigma-B regulation protein RsbU (phosphoserine phosphatase)